MYMLFQQDLFLKKNQEYVEARQRSQEHDKWVFYHGTVRAKNFLNGQTGQQGSYITHEYAIRLTRSKGYAVKKRNPDAGKPST